MSYELKIDDGVCTLDDFDECIRIIKEETDEFFENNEQCYYDRVPFSAGVLESYLYDKNQITEKQRVMFAKIRTLLRGFMSNDEALLDYIDHTYTLLLEDEDKYAYDFSITKNDDEIVLNLKVDTIDTIDYLETNLFILKPNRNYYFRTSQMVVTKSPNEPLELGTIVKIDISLTKLN